MATRTWKQDGTPIVNGHEALRRSRTVIRHTLVGEKLVATVSSEPWYINAKTGAWLVSVAKLDAKGTGSVENT